MFSSLLINDIVYSDLWCMGKYYEINVLFTNLYFSCKITKYFIANRYGVHVFIFIILITPNAYKSLG